MPNRPKSHRQSPVQNQDGVQGQSADQNVSPKKAANCRTEIGERLAARRMILGLDQSQLAEAFEVSRQAVSQYERGVTDINAGDLPYLAQILHVPVLYFLKGATSLEERLAEAISLLTPAERELVLGIVELIYDKRRDEDVLGQENKIRRRISEINALLGPSPAELEEYYSLLKKLPNQPFEEDESDGEDAPVEEEAIVDALLSPDVYGTYFSAEDVNVWVAEEE